MEKHLNDVAFVLKQRPLKEYDEVLVLFSRSHGKMAVVAKGIKRSSSKLRGALLPLMQSKISLVFGKRYYVMTGAEVQESYPEVRQDYKSLTAGQYFADALDRVLEEYAPEPEVYRLMAQVLAALPLIDTELLVYYFEWRLLALLGYGLHLDNCSNCRRPFHIGHLQGVADAQGNFYCRHCTVDDGTIRLYLSDEELSIFRVFDGGQIQPLQHVYLSEAARVRMDAYLNMRYGALLDRPLKSRKILKEMLA